MAPIKQLMAVIAWMVAVALGGCAAPADPPAPPTGEARASVPATATQPGAAVESHFLAMGDWGEDTAAERQVAAAMGNYARADDDLGSIRAVLLCGDNFYFKLTGVNDPRWATLFEQMYSPDALHVPFYACLGNHDYDGNNFSIELAYARQHPQGRFKMPAPWYRVDVPRDHPMATILMLDSNKENMSELQWNEQIGFLKRELAAPRATWTICCAHHPLFSNGFFWGNGVLQKDWGTLFQKYKVDVYLCGHEHDLEHLEIPGWFPSFVIAGGGGAHGHPLSRDDRGFSREAYGFVDFDLKPDRAVVRFIGTDGKPMHEFERTLAGKSKVLATTPNTPRTNPLKAYLQIKEPRGTRPQPATQP